MAATLMMSSRLLTRIGLESFLSSSVTTLTARSIPRFRAIASAPAVTCLRPLVKIASASTVAVVVPSPATLLVLVAASLTNWAPMFS